MKQHKFFLKIISTIIATTAFSQTASATQETEITFEGRVQRPLIKGDLEDLSKTLLPKTLEPFYGSSQDIESDSACYTVVKTFDYRARYANTSCRSKSLKNNVDLSYINNKNFRAIFINERDSKKSYFGTQGVALVNLQPYYDSQRLTYVKPSMGWNFIYNAIYKHNLCSGSGVTRMRKDVTVLYPVKITYMLRKETLKGVEFVSGDSAMEFIAKHSIRKVNVGIPTDLII